MAASGTGPPHKPECTEPLSARTVTSTATRPRSEVVIDGNPVSKFAVSVRTMASAASCVLVRGEEGAEVRRADLLFPLDEHLHVDGRASRLQPGGQRGGVHDHSRLVVRRPATEETAIAHDRLERIALPLVAVAGRLHVVMRVEEHRGRSLARDVGRVEPLPINVRMDTRLLDEPHLLEAALLEQIGGGVGAVHHPLGREPGEGHAGHTDQVAQLFLVLLLRRFVVLERGVERHG